jgi:hypothetical protein
MGFRLPSFIPSFSPIFSTSPFESFLLTWLSNRLTANRLTAGTTLTQDRVSEYNLYV